MRIFAITSVPVAANANVTRKYSETYTDGATVTNSKRCQYINHELKEQEELGIDSACILNWYCSYERRKFAGKYINVDYLENIPANECPCSWW